MCSTRKVIVHAKIVFPPNIKPQRTLTILYILSSQNRRRVALMHSTARWICFSLRQQVDTFTMRSTIIYFYMFVVRFAEYVIWSISCLVLIAKEVNATLLIFILYFDLGVRSRTQYCAVKHLKLRWRVIHRVHYRLGGVL